MMSQRYHRRQTRIHTQKNIRPTRTSRCIQATAFTTIVTWLKNHPISDDPNKTLGGIYAAKEAMEERVEEVKKSVPDISHFFTLTDHMHDYSKESRDYITALMAKYKKPTTKEEAYRTLGKMFLDGFDVVTVSGAPQPVSKQSGRRRDGDCTCGRGNGHRPRHAADV